MANRYEENNELKIYFDSIRRFPLLTREEEIALAKGIEKGDREAYNRLYHSNLKLVIHLAKQFQERGLPIIDLIQEGNLGLMKAVERYDHKKGKFSSYSANWIKQAMRNALRDKVRTIRIKSGAYNILSKIEREKEYFIQKNGTTPTLEELARQMNVPYKRLSDLLLMERVSSLDSPVNEDGTFGDFVPDTRETTEMPAEYGVLQEEIKTAFSRLNEREREVVQRRYGFSGEQETLDSISKSYGLTKETIRQIAIGALKKLRVFAVTKKLVTFLGR